MNHLDQAQLEIAVCDWLKAEPLGWEYANRLMLRRKEVA